MELKVCVPGLHRFVRQVVHINPGASTGRPESGHLHSRTGDEEISVVQKHKRKQIHMFSEQEVTEQEVTF